MEFFPKPPHWVPFDRAEASVLLLTVLFCIADACSNYVSVALERGRSWWLAVSPLAETVCIPYSEQRS